MNSTVSTDFLRQRRAVYHGLCGVLAEHEADIALSLWMERFQLSGSAFSGLNSFVRELCQQYGRPELQREMLLAINRALMAKEDDLRPAPSLSVDLDPSVATNSRLSAKAPARVEKRPAADPVRAEVVSADATGGAAEFKTAEFQTLQVFLLELFDQVDIVSPASGMQFRDFIKEVVAHSPWSESQQLQLTQLIEQGATVQTRPYRQGQLKTLVKQMQAWLVDSLGEGAATTVVSQAIAGCSQHAAASAYSPRLFF